MESLLEIDPAFQVKICFVTLDVMCLGCGWTNLIADFLDFTGFGTLSGTTLGGGAIFKDRTRTRTYIERYSVAGDSASLVLVLVGAAEVTLDSAGMWLSAFKTERC